MSVCQHCARIGGGHAKWCAPPAAPIKYRIERTGNIIVHHPIRPRP